MQKQIGAAQAKAGAEEDVFVEGYRKKNPTSSIEQARSAFKNRPGTTGNPVKAPDSNSAAFKTGGKYDVNSLKNKWG
jgi:hypothetical protein